MKKCEQCAGELSENATACPACGASVPGSEAMLFSAQKTTPARKRGVLLAAVAVSALAASLLVAWVATRKEGDAPSKAEPVVNLAEVRAKAERGDAEAQKNLGKIYARGELAPQNYEEAAKWYRQAAEQGYAQVQTALAGLYESGR